MTPAHVEPGPGGGVALTFGSLFAGIGGFDLGLERAGMQCRWQVEIDPFCQRVLAKHWPDVLRYGDITRLDFSEVEPVDLICGGFPCQPVSSSGRKQAELDSGWLWPEYARAIRTLRPKYAVVENVSDLLHRGIRTVLGDLAEVGYRCEWECLPAAAFGLPQRRWRVFLVAHRDSGRCGELAQCDSSWALSRGWIDTDGLALAQHRAQEATSRVLRVDDGLPHRLDRVRSLGNAIVPQVAEWIGRRIVEQPA